jgi:hypothetical protein
LIEAYQNGRISRRTFVRGMMALGVSASVAVSLADGVRAAPGSKTASRRGRDVYDDVYELPSTGIGDSGSGDSWVKPMAILGAGAALVAGGLRRLKGSTSTTE